MHICISLNLHIYLSVVYSLETGSHLICNFYQRLEPEGLVRGRRESMNAAGGNN
jgi:hypothetical protein